MIRKLISAFCALVFVLILISNTEIQAQDTRKFRFGLKGAGYGGWIKPDHPTMNNEGLGFGYSYGLMGDIRLGDNYAIALGMDMLTMGGKLEYLKDTVPQVTTSSSGLDSNIVFPGGSHYRYAINYVNLPIQLKMKTNEIGYMTYFGQFGFDVGVKYKAQAKVDYQWDKTAEAPRIEKADVSDEIALFRIGLVVGGGFEFNLTGNTNVMVGLTYSNGLLNQFDKKYKRNGEKIDNKTVEFDQDGNIKFDGTGNVIVDGATKKALNRYIALNVGIFF